MHWKPLLVVIALLNSGLAVKYKNEPPVMADITANVGNEDKVLNAESNYRVVCSTSDLDTFHNKLFCSAKNVEELVWEYKATDGGKWTTKLPDVVTKMDVKESNGGLDRSYEINDGSSNKMAQLKQLNGYYRCVAYNNNRNFTTLSPTIRLILPYYEGEKPAMGKPGGTPEANKSFMIRCQNPDGYTLHPSDTATYNPRFKWILKSTLETDFPSPTDDEEKKRIKIDPVTGDLYYAYLKPSDNIGAGDVRLRCNGYIGTYESIILNEVKTFTIGANDNPVVPVNIQYPLSSTLTTVPNGKKFNDPVVCISGQSCTLRCIFGGLAGESGEIRGVVPVEHSGQVTVNKGVGFAFIPVVSKNPIECLCQLVDSKTKQPHETVVYEVKVLTYPKLIDITDFPVTPRFKETGSTVKFVCQAEHANRETKFYFNGQEVSEGNPSFVTYSSADGSQFAIKNIQPEHSASVLCISKNSAGSLYSTTVLNVYNPPQVTQYPEAKDPHLISSDSNNTERTYHFNCSVKLDLKTTSADIYWMSNRSSVDAKTHITTKDNYGVKAVTRRNYDHATGIILSSLTVQITLTTKEDLRATDWWCVVGYSVLGRPIEKPARSDKVLFDFVNVPIIPQPQKAWPHLPVVLGAIGGFLFLILLIVLINCYVQKNKGEQYYVDEKERKAGHNPEEELEAYGFSDYTRPDQNPVKGSRASMNFSDKPMESDTGSLDEYGDIDPGRYNEDGSFIGQYGQNGQPSRNQADV